MRNSLKELKKKNREKILAVLKELRETTITVIAKKTGLSPITVRNHLRELVYEGIVEKVPLTKVHFLYRLKTEEK